MTGSRVRMWRDGAGDPRAEAASPFTLLAGFLESELMDDPGACDRLLAVIDALGAGQRHRFREVGNAIGVRLDVRWARLWLTVPIAAEEAVARLRLPIATFADVVRDWRSFLDR